MLVVLVTVPAIEEGERLARSIVSKNLAACVQILPQMTSVYTWKDEIQTDSENLLLIKTLEEKFDELSEFISENHSYDIPEIVAIKADRVSEGYSRWLTDSLENVKSG